MSPSKESVAVGLRASQNNQEQLKDAVNMFENQSPDVGGVENTKDCPTGVIKTRHHSGNGIFKIITPLELRGQEALFYDTDVDISNDLKAFLEPGMIMQFQIEKFRLENETVPWIARNIKPKDPAEYQGSVIRGPTPRGSGHGFVVCLDLNLNSAKVSAESYNALKLENPPNPGDSCTVRIPWQEMIQAAQDRRAPICDIVSLIPRPPRVSCTLRTLSDKSNSNIENKSNSNIENQIITTPKITKPKMSKILNNPYKRSVSLLQQRSVNCVSKRSVLSPYVENRVIPFRQAAYRRGNLYDSRSFEGYGIVNVVPCATQLTAPSPRTLTPPQVVYQQARVNGICQPVYPSINFNALPQGYTHFRCV